MWILALIVMNVLWAGSYTVMKIAAGSLSPLAIVFWRMFLAAIMLTVWCAIKRYQYTFVARDVVRMCVVGALSATAHLLVVLGVSYSHAADASLLYVIEPVWGIVLATMILRERFSLLMGIGLTLIAGGIVVLSRSPTAVWSGNLIIVAGLLCEGSFSVAIKPVVHRYPAAITMTVMLWSCVVLLLVPTMVFSPRVMPVTTGEWSEVLYLAFFCSVVGYLGWIIIMRHIPVNVMYFSIFIQPLVGPFIAWFALGEHIDASMVFAALLLLAGMSSAITSHVTHRRRAKLVEPVPMANVA